jgi:hypothetical protein
MASMERMKTAGRLFGWGVLILGATGCEQTAPQKGAPAEVAQVRLQAPVAKPPEGPSQAPAPNTLRLVIVASDEPLASEKAEIAKVVAALEKAKIKVDASPPSAEEKQAAGELASEQTVDVKGWSPFETVVVLEVVAPEGSEKGKRVSRGRGSVFIVHPPTKTPVFSTIYKTADKGGWLDGGKFGSWLATHLRYRKGEEGKVPPPEEQGPTLVKKEGKSDAAQ